jgi:eukaryotic-like serine/threonine-protein kinase
MGLSIPEMALMSRLLDEALPLDAVGRRAWLTRLAPQYQHLAEALRGALLPEDAQSAGFGGAQGNLSKIVFPTMTPALAIGDLQVGARVGPYELIRALGAGGMGQVWLARRADGAFKRDVALKVPTLTHLRADIEQRFARERDILASLEHRHIARFYDAGVDVNGLPYLALEYVQGQALSEWCDAHRLSIRSRLELLLQVLDAVLYAHAKHVVHRDLKPSNILVKDSGEVQLLDFGVAKLLEAQETDQAQLTAVYGRALTPDYASPELLRGDPTDARSDVYSLGVVLYELLTGARPYRLKRAASLGMLEQAMSTMQVRKPSEQIEPAAAAARASTPQRLPRALRGDLDAIALKALARDPAERYPSAATLAEDLRRYLAGRTVKALPARFPHQLRKAIGRNRALIGVSATAVAALLAAGGYILYREAATRARTADEVAVSAANGADARKFTGKGSVVLGDFANTTGDAALDGSLRQLMTVELGKSPHLSVLSDARVKETLRLMVRAPDTKLTPDVASEICERTASAAAIESSITSLGSKYVLGMRVRNCRTGDVLDQEQATAERKEDVFKVLAQVAERFRTWAGESLPRTEKAPAATTEVTTPSLEAWRSYNTAWKAIKSEADTVESVSLLKRAIEIDPQFAMAHAVLGRLYDGLEQSELGAQSIARAYELRDRVSDQENLFITFNYYRQVPRNLELARQTLESWIRKYPDDMIPHSFLSGLTSPGTGHHERAAEEGQRAIELDPDFAVPYYNAAFAYLYLNRVLEAEALLHKAAERKLEVAQFSLLRYFIAFLANDRAAMEREATQRKKKLEAQGWFEHQEALTLAYQGRLHEANRLSERAVSLARQAGLPERAAMYAGARAVWNALYGIRAEAQRSTASALSLFRGRDADYGPAFALALLGQAGQARKIYVNLGKRFPEDTSVQFSYLPVLRALDALDSGDPAKAVEMTQSAAGYELAVPAEAYLGTFVGALYPVYVRGLAYSRTGRYGEAAVEFQKILDHPGLVLNDPIGPLARLQLARGLSASGEHARSALVYRDLLAIWEGADPDIAILNQARAEYAKLR